MANNTAKTRKTEASVKKNTRAKKTTTPKQMSASHSVVMDSSEKKNMTTGSPAVRIKKSYMIILAVIIILAVLIYFFKGFFVVATVNGAPVSRLALYRELELEGGKQALSTLVTKTLIGQEAAKEHVTVTQQEVNDAIKSIQNNLASQGQTLDQALAAQGMTRSSLEEQVKLQKLVEKMAGKGITVSDKEVGDYMTAHKDTLPKTANTATIKQSLLSQKIQGKISAWVSNLQKNAKINYFVQY